MSYRDDHEAALARNDALEAEVAQLRSERDALAKAAANAQPPSPAKREPAPRRLRGDVTDGGHSLAFMLGGIVLIALPLIPGIATHTWAPAGAQLAGLAILTLAGPLLAGTSFRLLRPDVPLYETIEGEHFEVERSTRTRRIHFAIALAAYVLGALLAK